MRARDGLPRTVARPLPRGGTRPGGDGKAGALWIVPVGAVEPVLSDYLAFTLPEVLGLSVHVFESPLAADDAYDPVRRQWDAGTLLKSLSQLHEAESATRVLGVADLDLFIPILTFVFGLAHLGAKEAVVSLHRLRPEFYGLPPDPDLLLTRLEKETLHELGHTGHLRHCPDYACVMHYSNAVDEVDLKTSRFCPLCAQRIRWQ